MSHVEEFDIGRRLTQEPCHNLRRSGPLKLISVPLPDWRSFTNDGSLVPLDLRIIPSGFAFVLEPVVNGRPPDDIEKIFGELKKDHVADHVSIRAAWDVLLCLVDA